MRILFTGNYLPDYNRTTIIKAGLRKLGHQIIELPFEKINADLKIKIKEASQESDFVFMPSFTHREVRSVRKIVGKQKFIIFDPLISRFLTKVFDYKLVSRFSLSALRNYYRDKLSMQAADMVVTDTLAHKEYFHNTFGIPKEKMKVLYIGNNFDVYFPSNAEPLSAATFRVGFYGGFIPLQGVMKILAAAKLLKEQKDIEFYLIGSGFEFDSAKKFINEANLTNVKMPGWVKEGLLPNELNHFDLALGIFGANEKSNLVIPNKIYHYGACARAVITQKSVAIQELFTHGENIWLVDADPVAISEAILSLKKDTTKRQALGQSMYNLLKNKYSEVSVAEMLIEHYKKATSHIQ